MAILIVRDPENDGWVCKIPGPGNAILYADDFGILAAMLRDLGLWSQGEFDEEEAAGRA